VWKGERSEALEAQELGQVMGRRMARRTRRELRAGANFALDISWILSA